ncbi:hypothetical protein F5146DRAFT_999579 [Armillaria mellea]|nr:hypothetical protein F5146DRAFT_999579 [Armillaria mellea]
MATSETLIGSGNTAYMQLRLHLNSLERERGTIVEEKNQLRKELIAVAAREVLQLPQLPQAVAPLESKEYPNVKFWQQKAYQAFIDKAKSEMDGMAHSKPKQGCLKKIQDDDDDDDSPSRHPYLKHSDGSSVTHDNILKQAHLLSVWWGDVDSDAEDYVTITMTNKFEVFQLCDAGWKLWLYIMKTYSSWSCYHHPTKIAAKDKKWKHSDSSSTNNDNSTPELPVLNEDGLIPLDDDSAQSPDHSSPLPGDDINMLDLDLPDLSENSGLEVPDLFDPLYMSFRHPPIHFFLLTGQFDRNDIYGDMDLSLNPDIDEPM